MKYRTQIMPKNPRRNSEKISQASVLAVKKPWSDDVTGSVPRLTLPQLQALSRKGLWGLLLFLLVSVAAFLVQDFNLYATFPEPVLQILGCPPPAILIHLAITGYSFTVIVPVLIRMATGDSPVVRWYHLHCRAIFYLFYLASTTLPENFLAVTIIGILLYTVEQVGIWAYLYKNLHGAESSG